MESSPFGEFSDLLSGLESVFAAGPKSVFSSIKLGDAFTEAQQDGGSSVARDMRFPRLDLPAGVGGAQPSATSEKAKVDSMWVMSALDHDGPGPNRTGAPAPSPGKLSEGGGKTRNGKSASAFKYLSAKEIARLRELQLGILNGTRDADGGDGKGPSVKARLAASEYARENERIRRALMSKRRASLGRGGLKQVQRRPEDVLRSTALDNLMQLEKIEASAAAVIQAGWRRHQRLLYWRE